MTGRRSQASSTATVAPSSQHRPCRGELLARVAWFPAEISAAIVCLGVSGSRRFGLCLCRCCHEAYQSIADSCCIGSLVAPSKVKLLITERITTPRRMNSRITSHTSGWRYQHWHRGRREFPPDGYTRRSGHFKRPKSRSGGRSSRRRTSRGSEEPHGLIEVGSKCDDPAWSVARVVFLACNYSGPSFSRAHVS
jgi:hypothetical protein